MVQQRPNGVGKLCLARGRKNKGMLSGTSKVPETDYQVGGNAAKTLTFTSAPANSAAIKVVYLGRQHQVGTIAAGSLTDAGVNATAGINTTKFADGSISNITMLVLMVSGSILSPLMLAIPVANCLALA